MAPWAVCNRSVAQGAHEIAGDSRINELNTSPTRKRGIDSTPRLRVGLVFSSGHPVAAHLISGQGPKLRLPSVTSGCKIATLCPQ